MRIAGLHIDGFGIFHDLDIAGFSPGLNVILGENESGKTTLLAFLRTILFGFPPGQRRENIYPPLAGGRHGGHLTLMSGEGEEYVVSRYQGRKRGPVTVTLPDGNKGDEEIVRQLTGAATEDLFRSIFAFSLEELQRFDSLNKQAVKAAIYSAGAGVGKVSLAKVEKGLQDAIGKIFKPGGRNPIINILLRELQEIDRNIGQRVAEIEGYDGLQAEIHQMAVEVGSAKDSLDRKRRRLDRVRLLESGWEDWVSLCRIREEIANLPKIEVFPTDGVTRLEKLQERERLLQIHKGELVHKIEQVKKDLDAFEERPVWLSVGEKIHLLERGLERFSAANVERTEIRSRLQNQRKALENDLKGLGPDWQMESLDQFDASVSAREEILRCQEALERTRDAKREATRSFARATSSLEQAEVREREAEKAIGQIPEPKVKDPRVLLEQRFGIRSLRSMIQAGRDLRRALGHLKQRQDDLRDQKNGLSEQMEGIGTSPLWPVVVAVLLFAAAGVAAGWYRNLFAGVIIATVGLLVSVALLWFSLGQRKSQRLQRDLLKRQFFEIGEKLDSFGGEEVRLLAEISANDQEIVRPAQTFGLAPQPSLEEVDQAEAVVETEQEALHLWQPTQQRYQECKEERERRQKELTEEEQRLKNTQKELQGWEQHWQSWLRKAGLAESLSPSGALEVMERIRSLRQRAGSMRELEERLKVIGELVQSYQEEARSIARQLDVKDALVEDIEPLVHRMVVELEHEEKVQRSREQLQRQFEEYTAEREQNDLHVQQVEKELNHLFKEGGATDEAEFRQRAHLYDRHTSEKQALEQHLRNLENFGGRGEDQVRFQEELKRCSPERLQEERDELEQDVQELEIELASLQEQFGRLDERREQLESAEELSALRQRRNGLMAELKDAARRWSVLTIGLRFFEKGREIYEKERKQPVVRESEHFFRTITAGRYQSIVAPHGEERIQILGANGSRYDLEMLSRGTAEQLYLCLRFGYIEEFGRRARPLPVVVDDILVNFDPQRARAAIRTMLGLAEKNQIIFFTCHPEAVCLIKELDQKVPVWQLEGGRCRLDDLRSESTS